MAKAMHAWYGLRRRILPPGNEDRRTNTLDDYSEFPVDFPNKPQKISKGTATRYNADVFRIKLWVLLQDRLHIRLCGKGWKSSSIYVTEVQAVIFF